MARSITIHSQVYINPFHARSIAVTVTRPTNGGPEVKPQENRELDSIEMYRCQKNDLAAK